MSDNNYSGALIKQRRKILNLTLKELGESIDLSEGQLSKIENGKSPVTVGIAEKLSPIIGISVINILFPPSDEAEEIKEFPLVFNINNVNIAKKFLERIGIDNISRFTDEEVITHANFLRTSVEIINQSKKEH